MDRATGTQGAHASVAGLKDPLHSVQASGRLKKAKSVWWPASYLLHPIYLYFLFKCSPWPVTCNMPLGKNLHKHFCFSSWRLSKNLVQAPYIFARKGCCDKGITYYFVHDNWNKDLPSKAGHCRSFKVSHKNKESLIGIDDTGVLWCFRFMLKILCSL